MSDTSNTEPTELSKFEKFYLLKAVTLYRQTFKRFNRVALTEEQELELINKVSKFNGKEIKTL